MTKQDFELIAGVISHLPPEMRSTVAWAFIHELKASNPRFDAARWLKACHVGVGPTKAMGAF